MGYTILSMKALYATIYSATVVFLVVLPSIVGAQEKTLVSDSLGLGSGDFSGYLNNLFELALLVGAVLAVIMIATAGLQYMSSEAVSGKTAGKERIQQALIGLLMLLGIWLFYNEINPDILKLDVNMEPTRVEEPSPQQ